MAKLSETVLVFGCSTVHGEVVRSTWSNAQASLWNAQIYSYFANAIQSNLFRNPGVLEGLAGVVSRIPLHAAITLTLQSLHVICERAMSVLKRVKPISGPIRSKQRASGLALLAGATEVLSSLNTLTTTFGETNSGKAARFLIKIWTLKIFVICIVWCPNSI